MENRIRGNEYRTTIVCVDSYTNGVLAGRFFNPYRREGERFQSLTQFLVKMEQVLDVMNLPQSFTSARAFAPPPKRKPGDAGYRGSGGYAGNLRHTRHLSSECQLAGFRQLAGGGPGAELPQRSGVGPADEQRIG